MATKHCRDSDLLCEWYPYSTPNIPLFSLSVLILSVTYDDEVKLVIEKDAGVVNIEKLQAHAGRVLIVFPDKTFPGR